MRCRRFLTVVVLAVLAIVSCGCDKKNGNISGHTGQLEIQFIGNAAFHITDGKTTLLIDFPYESGFAGYMQYKMEDIKPIKDGLCLITHSHSDHWDVELFENMDHSIIVPPEEYVESEKIIPFDDVMAFKDITIQAFKTCHVGRTMEFEHYSYLVTWHGLRLYIFGDAVEDHALTMKDIDIMFLPVWLTGKIKNQKLTLDAKTLILFHHKSDQKVSPSKDCLVLKQGETLEVEFIATKQSPADIVRSAAAEGKLAYKLTTPEEVKEAQADEATLRLLNKTIKKVGDDIESFGFNTAISAMMIFVNHLSKQAVRPKSVVKKFVLILAPFSPHIAEELWEKLGHKDSLAFEPWPEYDRELIKEKEIELAVQVNGKIKDRIVVSADADEEQIKQKALASKKVIAAMAGKEPKKIIVIKSRLVNVVV